MNPLEFLRSFIKGKSFFLNSIQITMKSIRAILFTMIVFLTVSCEKNDNSPDNKDNSTFNYPSEGYYGVNILDREKTTYDAGHYSFNAILAEGDSLKVKVSGNNWGFYEPGIASGWKYTSWDNSDSSRIFSSGRSGELDMDFQLWSSSTYNFDSLTMKTDTFQLKTFTKIAVYENDAVEPTWTKTIMVP